MNEPSWLVPTATQLDRALGGHLADYDDARGAWACSCGYTARTLAAVRRHASGANAAERAG